MRRTALSCSFFLAMALLAVAAPLGGTGSKTAPHQINGVLDGALTFVPYGPGELDVDSLGDVSGIVTSLGRVNMFTFHRPYVADPPDDPPIMSRVKDGLARIVAANGDVIRCQYVGTTETTQNPLQLIGRADWVVTGGTGRFAQANGVIHATAYVTIAICDGHWCFEWPVTWVLEGTINY